MHETEAMNNEVLCPWKLHPISTTDIENLIWNPINSAIRRIAFRHFRPGNDGATNQYYPVNPVNPVKLIYAARHLTGACTIKLQSMIHKGGLFY